MQLTLLVECQIENGRVVKWFQFAPPGLPPMDCSEMRWDLQGSHLMKIKIGFHAYTQLVIDYTKKKDEAVVLAVLNRFIEEGFRNDRGETHVTTALRQFEWPWDGQNPIYRSTDDESVDAWKYFKEN